MLQIETTITEMRNVPSGLIYGRERTDKTTTNSQNEIDCEGHKKIYLVLKHVWIAKCNFKCSTLTSDHEVNYYKEILYISYFVIFITFMSLFLCFHDYLAGGFGGARFSMFFVLFCFYT